MGRARSSGNYVGLSAEVAAGLGAGANALIGGNKVVLQPVSVSGNIGINLAAGDRRYQPDLCGRRRTGDPRMGAVPIAPLQLDVGTHAQRATLA